MPLLVARRSSHGVALVDHHHAQLHRRRRSPSAVQSAPAPYQTTDALSATRSADSAVDFSMSKFKASSRHSLYRQFYGGDESPPYEKPEETGKLMLMMLLPNPSIDHVTEQQNHVPERDYQIPSNKSSARTIRVYQIIVLKSSNTQRQQPKKRKKTCNRDLFS
uniref:Uncharacterized protein n=1 Tax=Anopheles maculatus TaxID=74869 RepID=A0A182S7K9_9DIPT